MKEEDIHNEDEKPETSFFYKGNQIPKVLKGVYAIFITWAILYFAFYSLPDLIEWLK